MSDKEDLIINSIKYYNNKYDIKYSEVEDLKVRIENIKEDLKYYSDMYDFESGDLKDIKSLIDGLKLDLKDVKKERIEKINKEIKDNIKSIVFSSHNISNNKVGVMLNNSHMFNRFVNDFKSVVDDLNKEFYGLLNIVFDYDEEDKVIKLKYDYMVCKVFLFSAENCHNLKGFSFNDFFMNNTIFEYRGKRSYSKKDELYITFFANLTLHDCNKSVKMLRIY